MLCMDEYNSSQIMRIKCHEMNNNEKYDYIDNSLKQHLQQKQYRSVLIYVISLDIYLVKQTQSKDQSY